jgi:hypothetical protein
MTGDLRATPLERRFLRGIAAVNSLARQRGEEGWWSPDELRITALFPDFRHATVMSLAGLGRSCVRKKMAVSRQIGTRGHGWTEYQITGLGRGLVADSCIGGGLRWTIAAEVPVCPACRSSSQELSLPGPVPAEVPAHALPGYAASSRAHDTPPSQTGGDHDDEQGAVR